MPATIERVDFFIASAPSLMTHIKEGTGRALAVFDKKRSADLPDIPTLVERTARRSHRPLLKDRDAGKVLRELAAVRNPIYAEAHIRVSSASSPHEYTVRAILQELSQWKA